MSFRVVMASIVLTVLLMVSPTCAGQMTLLGAGRTAAAAGGFTPASLPGIIAWYKADSGVSTDSGCTVAATNGQSVACWKDQIGTCNLVQATGASQPTFLTNILNSLPVVNGNGSQFMQCPAINLAGTTVSVFMVVQQTSGSFARAVGYASDTANNGFIATYFPSGSGANTNPTSYNALVGNLSSGTITGSSWNEIGTIWDGVNNTMYIANSAQTPVASTPTFATNGTLNLMSNEGGGNVLVGSIAEIIVCTGALGSTDRSNLRTYLLARWGV